MIPNPHINSSNPFASTIPFLDFSPNSLIPSTRLFAAFAQTGVSSSNDANANVSAIFDFNMKVNCDAFVSTLHHTLTPEHTPKTPTLNLDNFKSLDSVFCRDSYITAVFKDSLSASKAFQEWEMAKHNLSIFIGHERQCTGKSEVHLAKVVGMNKSENSVVFDTSALVLGEWIHDYDIMVCMGELSCRAGEACTEKKC